ncbi:hypothetical protein K9N68_31410 [Kovacikia minuta CCNUW1]|uniref:hypothetical protein n=1 Tax=Kovacikia minuta TaxID=2931930 RepID=UPI001CCDED44|nr:hypothetical protein [Kovacikia minuta]UBF25994.1 hypothetical protein K9N68_31410 [Kovacikia minuta CCNUW1]
MKAPIRLHHPGVLNQRIGQVNPTLNRSRKPTSIAAFLKKLWRGLLAMLIVNNDLKVWHERDRRGNLRWHAFDPLTKTSVSLDSEDDMRAWIEQHYYTGITGDRC